MKTPFALHGNSGPETQGTGQIAGARPLFGNCPANGNNSVGFPSVCAISSKLAKRRPAFSIMMYNRQGVGTPGFFRYGQLLRLSPLHWREARFDVLSWSHPLQCKQGQRTLPGIMDNWRACAQSWPRHQSVFQWHFRFNFFSGSGCGWPYRLRLAHEVRLRFGS